MAQGRPYLIKLVRDKMANLLANSRIEYKPVPKKLAIQLRRDKLVEEAMEFWKNPSVNEAADVYQALTDCIRDLPDGTLHHVLEASLEKNAERGGFGDGIGMFAYTLSDGTYDSPEKMLMPHEKGGVNR